MPDRLLIVSPVRNEAAHIERVVAGMAAQTHPPACWIVADDGSTDGTADLLRALEPTVPFMRVVALPPAPPAGRDRLAAAAAPRAFNAGLRHADWREFTHVGKLDGDIELDPDYYAELLRAFARDPSLGICCGTLIEHRGGRPHRLRVAPNHVHGALKLYTRSCFEAIGGVQERLGWDTIDQTYARMRGYRTVHLDAPLAIHHRPTGSADGTLRGRARHGACAYISHYPLPWVAARAVKVGRMPPAGLSGLAFLYGFLRAGVHRIPRVEDPEYRRFARRELRRRAGRELAAGVRRALHPRPARSEMAAGGS
jgi:glycosyltransferase involved in cell wall biosynthesis